MAPTFEDDQREIERILAGRPVPLLSPEDEAVRIEYDRAQQNARANRTAPSTAGADLTASELREVERILKAHNA